MSGRGLLPALCITIGFFLLDRYKNWKVFSGLLLFLKTEKMKKIVSIITIILVCILMSGIELDSILIDLQPIVGRNEMTYKMPIVWSGFPVVLFSYSPLILLLFFVLVVPTKKID